MGAVIPAIMQFRFWPKVTFPEEGLECWVWRGARNNHGYGQLNLDNKRIYAHRIAWEHCFGPIPHGLCVLHRCDNPPCINPAHLFLGTYVDNALDMVRKGRDAATRHPERVLRGDQHPSHLRPETRPRGEAHSGAKLTVEKVREIRRRFAAGVAARALAREFGLGRSTIQHVIHRESWKSVPEEER